jgi:hypothetical protein
MNTDSITVLFSRDGIVTELTIDRLILGELTDEEERKVRARLESCDRSRALFEAVEEFDAGLREEGVFVPPPSLLQREESSDQGVVLLSNKREEKRQRAAFSESSVARFAAAACVILASVALLRWDPSIDPAIADGPGAIPDGAAIGVTRVKGSAFRFDVFVHDGEESRQAADGEVVQPGDRVGFKVFNRKPGHLMIVGVDDNLKPYTCYPQDEARAQERAVTQEAEELKQAMELDSNLGRERFVAYFCHETFGSDQAHQWAKVGLEQILPEGCVRRSVTLQKKPSETP